MPLFEIRKSINTILVVDCASEQEAAAWASKIVATIEDENGQPIQSDTIVSFEADSKVSELETELL